MKNQNSLMGFIFISFGLYFLLRQFNMPYMVQYHSWPTLLVLTGSAFLLHSYKVKDYTNLFTGAVLFGIGIHFHGLHQYTFWIDHWGIYLLIIGIALLLRFKKTKSGLILGIILTGIALYALVSKNYPVWFNWIHDLVLLIKRFWPILVIGCGVYMINRKSKTRS